jgi:hypothetical protein
MVYVSKRALYTNHFKVQSTGIYYNNQLSRFWSYGPVLYNILRVQNPINRNKDQFHMLNGLKAASEKTRKSLSI